MCIRDRSGSVFANLSLMIDDILSNVEHRWGGTLSPSTSLVAVADELVNPDIDGADNECLGEHNTTVDTQVWFDRAEKLDT